MFPFKMANCWRPSRSFFGKRTRASINRISPRKKREKRKKKREVQRERKREEKEREKGPDQVEHTAPAQEHLSRGHSSPCIVHHQPLRQSTTPHTRVGYYTTSVARTSINLVSFVCSSFQPRFLAPRRRTTPNSKHKSRPYRSWTNAAPNPRLV